MKTLQEIKKIIPGLTKLLELMSSSYEDLQSARGLYNTLDKAYYNVFPKAGEMEYDDRSVDILKSGFCHSAVEIASRGMKFPVFRVDVSSGVDIEKRNAEEGAKAALEWVIKESGFENVYQKSKEHWAKFGDAYRRQYVRKVMGPNGGFWPQYEMLNPRNLLLDSDATQVWSTNFADSATFYGYSQILDERQAMGKYGKDILEHITDGAIIDVDSYSDKAGKTKNVRYYEELEINDRIYGQSVILLGAGGFPVVMTGEADIDINKFSKKERSVIRHSPGLVTKNKLGENELNITNTYFFHDSRGPRNLGIVHKLVPSQKNNEIVENLKTEATRLKMLEIPTVAGGREDIVSNAVDKFLENRKESLLTFMHAASNIEGVIPKFDMIRFNGVTAEDAAQTTRDIYEFARNTSGIDLTRLEIQSNVTLGQSQLIEQEKSDTLEQIINQNKDSIEREYAMMLDNFILHKGYGQDKIFVSYSYEKEIPGVTDGATPVTVVTKREIDLVSLAEELAGHRKSIIIDDSALVNRTYTTMMGEWIKLLGVVDPAAVPKLYQFLIEKIGEAGRFKIPDQLFEGVENQQAQGGMSQFSSSPEEPSPDGEVSGMPQQ